MKVLTRFARRGLVRDFVRDESGGATILNIFLFMAICVLCGIAIDGSNAYMHRTMMQASADAAATAGAQFLPVEADVQTAAVTYVEANMAVGDFGIQTTNADITIGNWDASTRTFTVGDEDLPANSVQVTVRRDDTYDNSLPTFLLKLAGFWEWDFSVKAMAISVPAGRDCFGGGFFSREAVEAGSNNHYVDNFCLHGDNYVKIGSDNAIEEGAIISMNDTRNFIESQGNEYCPEVSEDPLNPPNCRVALDGSEGLQSLEFTISLPDKVADIIDEMAACTLDNMPPWIKNCQTITNDKYEIKDENDFTEGTLYIAKKGAQIESDVNVQNIGIVTLNENDLTVGSNVKMYNMFLASSKTLTTGSANSFGDIPPSEGVDNFCDTGYYNVYMLSLGEIVYGSGTGAEYFGMQIVSRDKITFGSELAAMEGVYGEAIGQVKLSSGDVYGACPTPLQSVFGSGAAGQRFTVDGVNAGGGTVLVQ